MLYSNKILFVLSRCAKLKIKDKGEGKFIIPALAVLNLFAQDFTIGFSVILILKQNDATALGTAFGNLCPLG